MPKVAFANFRLRNRIVVGLQVQYLHIAHCHSSSKLNRFTFYLRILVKIIYSLTETVLMSETINRIILIKL
jgi:hypothetical protein